ncbi:MAG: hypothetical protein IVW51_08960 [Thermaceae bacterium]|nr:hypothetical protein [Thermaceae bacterium]
MTATSVAQPLAPDQTVRKIARLEARLEEARQALEECHPDDHFWIAEYTAILDDLEGRIAQYRRLI